MEYQKNKSGQGNPMVKVRAMIKKEKWRLHQFFSANEKKAKGIFRNTKNSNNNFNIDNKNKIIKNNQQQ